MTYYQNIAKYWLYTASKNTKSVLIYSFQTPARILLTGFTSVLTALIFILLIYPAFSYQLLTQDLAYIKYIVTALLRLDYAEYGMLGPLSIGVYSLLVGLLSTTVLGRVRLVRNNQDESKSTLTALFSITPGLILAGCASCGAGIFGLFGVYGLTTALPFGGLGLRLFAITLLVTVLLRTGDPRICQLD